MAVSALGARLHRLLLVGEDSPWTPWGPERQGQNPGIGLGELALLLSHTQEAREEAAVLPPCVSDSTRPLLPTPCAPRTGHPAQRAAVTLTQHWKVLIHTAPLGFYTILSNAAPSPLPLPLPRSTF